MAGRRLPHRVRDKPTQRNFDKLMSYLTSDDSAGLLTKVNAALAKPVMVGEAGGTLLAGQTAGSRVCNMDSTPKVITALANQVISWYYPDSWDEPALSGYGVEWKLQVPWGRNATSTGVNWIFGMWGMTGHAGGAGGYTETMDGAFTLATAAGGTSGPSDMFETAWVADALTQHRHYAFAVNNSGTLAASSAMRWRMRLFRRWVPV
jgi:hypothetical protein